MARVSEKALRPRQYVFHKLPPERSEKLGRLVRVLLDRERIEELEARDAVRRHDRNEAARHAQSILEGRKHPSPETEQIRALELELEDLNRQRGQLFEALQKELKQSSTVAKKEDVTMTESSDINRK